MYNENLVVEVLQQAVRKKKDSVDKERLQYSTASNKRTHAKRYFLNVALEDRTKILYIYGH